MDSFEIRTVNKSILSWESQWQDDIKTIAPLQREWRRSNRVLFVFDKRYTIIKMNTNDKQLIFNAYDKRKSISKCHKLHNSNFNLLHCLSALILQKFKKFGPPFNKWLSVRQCSKSWLHFYAIVFQKLHLLEMHV